MSKAEPRNVIDVDYAELDGQRPMREVLRDRSSRHNAQDKAMRENAFRERAFLQGQLASCLCCWPLEKTDTESEHAAWCPGHHLLLSKLAQEKLHR